MMDVFIVEKIKILLRNNRVSCSFSCTVTEKKKLAIALPEALKKD